MPARVRSRPLDVGRDLDAAEAPAVDALFQLGEGRVLVLQGQNAEADEAVRVARHGLGHPVVDHAANLPRDLDGLAVIVVKRRGRDGLNVDAAGVHVPDALPGVGELGQDGPLLGPVDFHRQRVGIDIALGGVGGGQFGQARIRRRHMDVAVDVDGEVLLALAGGVGVPARIGGRVMGAGEQHGGGSPKGGYRSPFDVTPFPGNQGRLRPCRPRSAPDRPRRPSCRAPRRPCPW